MEMDHHESNEIDVFKAVADLEVSLRNRYPLSHEYINDVDEKILPKIKTYSLWEISRIDGKFFYLCFKLGLNKVSFDLLSRKEFDESRFIELWSILLLADFNVHEYVVIKALELFKEKISAKLTEVNHQNENILHILLKNGLRRALQVILNEYDVSVALFAKDLKGDIPLTVAIGQSSMKTEVNEVSDIVTQIWNCMLRQNSPEIISESLVSQNRKKDNILHVCAYNHKHVLFAKACSIS